MVTESNYSDHSLVFGSLRNDVTLVERSVFPRVFFPLPLPSSYLEPTVYLQCVESLVLFELTFTKRRMDPFPQGGTDDLYDLYTLHNI